MKANNLTIIPPEGMEAYKEGNEIKFRPIKKELTYEDIARELFYDKTGYTLNSLDGIKQRDNIVNYLLSSNATSAKQLRKLLAINKLMNVAKYLNGNWKPDWNNKEIKYNIRIYNEVVGVTAVSILCSDVVVFKTRELAEQAIDILGEETIKVALSADW